MQGGTRLGHYEIIEPLGAGGMGEVYRARDTKLKRDVAIKVLPQELSADPDHLARLEREAHLLAALNHANIATIYALEEEEGSRFLVLELVKGESLEQRLSKGPLPVEKALDLCKQIAEALEAAHGEGIIHRDLKPANVLITPDGRAKVLDFGIAKSMKVGAEVAETAKATNLTVAGTLVGTPSYMSPEQIRGESIDKRADIWAFGCLLFETLTGKRAYGRETLADTLAAIVDQEPDWERLPDGAPPALPTLLRRCLAKDPRRRLRDIGDAWLEMDESQDETEATRRSAGQAAPMWWRPVPWASATVVAVAALWFFSGERSLTPEVTRFALNLPGSSIAFIGGRGVAVSPDGRTLVYSWSDAGLFDARLRLYRRDMDALESVPIRGTEGGRHPFFSSDGASIGFFTGSELRRVPLSGGISVPLADVVGESTGTWLDDDSIVFGPIVPVGRSLSRVSGSGGEPSTVASFTAEGQEATHAYPAAILGGLGFVSTGWSGDSSWVYLHQPGPGAPVQLVRGRRARVSPSGHLVFERDGTLWAVPLDVEQASVTGEPVSVVEAFGSTDNTPGFDVSAFDVSASGSLAYATVGADPWLNRSLFWVDRDGREEPLDIEPRPYWFPRVSPDGDRIGFHIMDAANMDIHIHDLRSGATSPLTFHESVDGYPLWTPDGGRIVFWSSRDGAPNLFSRPADGTGSVERLTDSPNRQAPYSWADGGRLLLFEEQSPETETDIWKVSIDGDSTAEPVLSEPYAERRPAISPDGRWIAYQSDESGQWQIWVRPFPDVERGRWPVGDGVSPKWSPDGRELYYRGDNAIMAVRIDATDEFSPAEPVRLFEDGYVNSALQDNFSADQYAVAPDGRFLMMKELPESQASVELIVVRNWAEELKRLVPTGGSQ
ncbi:MAG: protein kinase [Actinobacteria bacterium]|nr:protein kinase [Actinomycetota bacterium]